jgi:hypothetical protein
MYDVLFDTLLHTDEHLPDRYECNQTEELHDQAFVRAGAFAPFADNKAGGSVVTLEEDECQTERNVRGLVGLKRLGNVQVRSPEHKCAAGIHHRDNASQSGVHFDEVTLLNTLELSHEPVGTSNPAAEEVIQTVMPVETTTSLP